MKLKTVEVNGKSYAEVDANGLPVYVHGDGKDRLRCCAGRWKISSLNGEAKSHREAKEAAEASRRNSPKSVTRRRLSKRWT
ncbi:hypothetical protein J4730_20780 [Klebsiella pneumoniae]|uniref:Uncharacterized protein n=1 Tax=Klebsiella pneumoniae TaxID=573 RepID=A0A939NJW6_KLEPN|nr:hypothetical protein [Klebsiella pneumoniae]